MSLNKALISCTLLCSLASAAALPVTSSQNGTLPIVDLGYEQQQALFYNSTGDFYSFNNIRYGAPPVGPLRWNFPEAPAMNRTSVQTGEQDRICSQSTGAWLASAGQFAVEFLGGQTVFNASSFPPANASASTMDPRETEDCLFLDVAVPKNIFDAAGSAAYGAPVLVWIHGGGYALGSKSDSGGPSGLITRSQLNGGEGVVYVSFNYRLGSFGFLAGNEVQANGTANAGIHDQRLALQWIQDNIHLFGGDPKRVTVFGESAGGGSIMTHIVAYGGKKGPAPFAQALMQSPAWQPQVSALVQNNITKHYFSAVGVSSLAEARNASYADLYRANVQQTAASNVGRFIFAPSADGDLIPDLPGRLLANGLFDHTVHVMTAHNTREGLLFTDPLVQSNSDYSNFLTLNLPDLRAWPSTLDYVTNTLYPPVFNSSNSDYSSQVGRAVLTNGELVFACNTVYANRAFGNNTHAYLFSASGGIHSADVPYSFYTGAGEAQPSTNPSDFGGVLYPELALVQQGYITRFAMTGNPNGPNLPYLPPYGSNSTTMEMNGTTFNLVQDPSANARCDFWQKGLTY